MSLAIRDFRAADLDAALALNQISRPGVGDLNMPRLVQLLDWCCHARIAEHSGQVAGMLLALDPGAAYPSENYRYFEANLTDHVYVDRIAVQPSFRNQGIGAALYADLFGCTGQRPVSCEVNVLPMNAGSLRFHERLGFVRLGEQSTEGGKKRVALLLRGG